MIKHLFLPLLLFFCLVTKSQEMVSSFAFFPSDPPRSTKDVAARISTRYQSQKEKLRAAYQWVTTNIRYDKDSSFALNAGGDHREKIDIAFQKRRGVCENFAAIFADICHEAGIEVYIIQGYTRSYTGVQQGGHTWCAAPVEGEWFFFDPTWDAGGSNTFFMVPPPRFIETHMPFDPIWQLLEYPISNADFSRGIFNRSWARTKLDYRDSIAVFLGKDRKYQLPEIEERMATAGLEAPQVKTHFSVVRMYLEMSRQEEQIYWHDSAVALVNKATITLNQFISLRNDTEIVDVTEQLSLLAGAESDLSEALQFLRRIDHSKATLVVGTWPAKERIDELRGKIQSQKNFLTSLDEKTTAKQSPRHLQ